MRNRKRNKLYLLIILMLAIGIGFAAISTTLNIDGSTTISKNNWKIYWDEDSIVVSPNSVSDAEPIVEDGTDGDKDTKLTWDATLDMPGDFYEFTIDAVNESSLDAMIIAINEEIPTDLVNYIRCSVTYSDGVTPAQYHILPKAVVSNNTTTPTKQKYRVRVEFLDTLTPAQWEAMPTGGLDYNFSYEVKYAQADDRAIPKPTFFGSASWSRIIEEYNNGDPNEILSDNMKEDATRLIDLDMNHDGQIDLHAELMIYNLSNPTECKNSTVSQSACGFVIGFKDYIDSRRMSAFDSNSYLANDHIPLAGQGGTGGWRDSDMRAYLNGKIYSPAGFDAINYANVSFMDSLPIELQNIIIDTKVISGHGQQDSSNFETLDKIYLLDLGEIYGETYTNQYHTALQSERQMDYYRSYNVTASNNLEYVSKGELTLGYETWWGWVRTVYSDQWKANYFSNIGNGGVSNAVCNDNAGFAPVFRIAN